MTDTSAKRAGIERLNQRIPLVSTRNDPQITKQTSVCSRTPTGFVVLPGPLVATVRMYPVGTNQDSRMNSGPYEPTTGMLKIVPAGCDPTSVPPSSMNRLITGRDEVVLGDSTVVVLYSSAEALDHL